MYHRDRYVQSQTCYTFTSYYDGWGLEEEGKETRVWCPSKYTPSQLKQCPYFTEIFASRRRESISRDTGDARHLQLSQIYTSD